MSCRRIAFLLLPVLLLPNICAAQVPGADEMERAIAAVRPQARSQGLSLDSGSLWLSALRERSPLVASLGGRSCRITYTAYTPGRDYRWLFPALPPAQRELWLTGFVHHELAHCLERAALAAPVEAAPAEGLAAGSAGARDGEVLADLAFALHVGAQGDDGLALVRHLAGLRHAQRHVDPLHDTSAALACSLDRGETPAEAAAPWLTRLLRLRAACSPR